MATMISVHDALAAVLRDIPRLGSERVGLANARGRVLAEAVRAGRDVPPFRNSAMDGYAVRASDVATAAPEAPVRLRVLEVVGAGSMPTRAVAPGTATKIMTGSPLPTGADAVVRVEDTEESGGDVVVQARVTPGTAVREPGEDMRAGETVLDVGRVLRPADIGLLASLGLTVVPVSRRPRVAILTTGNELVEPGEPLGPGQIVNSNAYTLAAAVEDAGAEAIRLGIVRDQQECIRAAFADAFTADMMLSTGGVSVGSFDFVRQTLSELGYEERFWKVAQKPGKPLTFGLRQGTPAFGLPGNPVSTLVCCYLYVVPALRTMMGMERIHLPHIEATLASEVTTAAGLTEFVRCVVTRIGPTYEVQPTGSQSSGVLRSLSAGEGLLIAPPEQQTIARGASVRVIVLGNDGTSAVAPF
ncbi:MAG: molybdopterin molybdotransferase MoeA [Deltaproteobacteria bacterium]|nr:molybdopterin molybdotransferase MoeA [Deltaproteobacteria bacterium]MBI3387544.1 molybdopterin molybdotransferase MoeA [Deltaproteobacteria bacterium]